MLAFFPKMLYSNYVCVDYSTDWQDAMEKVLATRQSSNMDCKEFERLIPSFLEWKMDFRLLKRFREHMDNCPNCKEELVIQFLVIEGMQRLEEGDVFDLQSELDQHLEEAKRKVKFHYRFMRIGEILEFILVLLVAGVVAWILM